MYHNTHAFGAKYSDVELQRFLHSPPDPFNGLLTPLFLTTLSMFAYVLLLDVGRMKPLWEQFCWTVNGLPSRISVPNHPSGVAIGRYSVETSEVCTVWLVGVKPEIVQILSSLRLCRPTPSDPSDFTNGALFQCHSPTDGIEFVHLKIHRKCWIEYGFKARRYLWCTPFVFVFLKRGNT